MEREGEREGIENKGRGKEGEREGVERERGSKYIHVVLNKESRD